MCLPLLEAVPGRNYDIGNQELLAVKQALEEWRNWLEEAEQPFVVWSDYKYLEYILSATRLNSRQTRWALFFNRYDFSLLYRPGSKNVDALSCQFQPERAPPQPERYPSSDVRHQCGNLGDRKPGNAR